MTDGGWTGRFADLRPRIVSAAVVGAVAFACIWAGGVWTAALISLFGAVMMWEWRSITAHAGGRCGADAMPYVLAPPAGVAAAFLGPGAWAGFLAAIVLGGIGAALDLMAGRRAIAPWGASGAVLIGAASIAFLWLRETDPFGVLATFWVVMVVVSTDVGGYFAGRLIGGPKLWPRVSPKKTWAGLGGAVGLAALSGLIFSGATLGTFYGEVCAASAAAAVLAQGGDLAESALKRRFGVKDSGTLLPGHGGALDRLDGLLAATLVVAAVTLWRGQTVFVWS